MEYNSDFKYDLYTGVLHGETWFHTLLEDKKIEVKYDGDISNRTENVYVEYECRGKRSGIATTEADYWVFKLSGERAIVIGTEQLKNRLRELIRNGMAKSGVKGGDNNLSVGVLVKIKDLI
jgi:hypothetical protein